MRNETAFYYSAYNQEYFALWAGTPFMSEVPDLCYSRAASCWLRNNDLGEEDRRKLLYSYLQTHWSTDLSTDQLNKSYPNLPTGNLTVKRVVSNIGYAYNEAPARQYKINGEDSRHSEEFNGILAEMDFDSYMRQAYQLAIMTNEVAMRPMLIDGKWTIDILTPDMYRVKRDTHGKPTLMYIPFQDEDKDGNLINKYKVWTELTYKELNTDGAKTEFEYNGKTYTEIPNIYGQIPYIFLKLSRNADTFGGGEWELAKTQLTCNMIDYLRDENLIFGTMGFWFFKNTGLKAEEIKFNPGRIFVKNDIQDNEITPEIEYIDSTPLWSELEDVKKTLIERTMKQMGLPMSLISDNPGLQSGVSMKIDRIELEERRKTDLHVLQLFEEDFINAMIRFNNVENNKGYEQISLNVDYIDSQVFNEPNDELDYLTRLKELGLISMQDYVIRLTGNTNITSDEAAIEFINKNKEVSNDRAGGTGGEPEQVEPDVKV